MNWRSGVLFFVGCAAVSVTASAQAVISAKSGVIHYLEGAVYNDDKNVDTRISHFQDIKEGGVLRTESGRAEVLLTPGVFLRLGENSSIKMISTRLSDTRVDILSGAALIEVAELLKDNAVTVVYKDATVELRKAGLYRFDGESDMLRVYKGEAVAMLAGAPPLTVKESKQVSLSGAVLSAEKFDNKTGDALYRWSNRRAEYVSVANISAANSLRQSGSVLSYSGWQFNPYFGMYTFMPMSGMFRSPFGYYFYSPREVYHVYAVRGPMPSYGGGGSGFSSSRSSYYDSNLGYTVVGSRAAMSSTPSSAPAAAASPSAGAGAAGGVRGGPSSVGRSAGGGGRGR